MNTKIFSCIAIILTIVTLVTLCLLGNSAQEYKDVVLEWTSITESNKSFERSLFYWLSILGIVLYFLFYKFNKTNNLNEKLLDINLYPIILFGLLFIFKLFVTSEANIAYAIFFIFSTYIYLFKRDKPDLYITFVFSCFAILALYTIYAYKHGKLHISFNTVFLLSSVITYFVGYTKSNFIRKFNLILQIFIPALLLVILTSDYQYHGELIRLSQPAFIKNLIFILIGLFFTSSLISLYRNWNTNSFACYITAGTCVSIMYFIHYRWNNGLFISGDLHHPFENMIGYSQVFELGQSLFYDYIPVSGMYSILEGAIHAFFGNAQVATIGTSHFVYVLLVILISFSLLSLHKINKSVLLVLALCGSVIDYNRTLWILPIVLLLSLNQLIVKPKLWFTLWCLTSLFHGLYYPLFGFAVAAAFLPIGINVARNIIHSLNKDSFKHIWIYLFICVNVIPIILCSKLLLGSLHHMMVMADQTVAADGLARFGQLLPDYFMPYTSKSIRFIFYYACTFVPVALVIILSIVMALSVSNMKIREVLSNKISHLFFIPAVILLVSLSYTSIRLDVGSIFARTTQPLLFCLMILGIFIFERKFFKFNKVFLVLSAICVVLCQTHNVGNLNGEASYAKYVPNDWIRTNEAFDGMLSKRMGDGFIPVGTADWIKNTQHFADDVIGNKDSFSVFPSFGFYYIFQKTGASVIEDYTVRGFEATKETVELLKEKKPLVAMCDPYAHYYLYKWLVTSGNYVFDRENNLFRYNVKGADVSIIHQDLPNRPPVLDLGRDPSAFGSSYASLINIFDKVDFNIRMSNMQNGSVLIKTDSFSGENLDYMYLEFVDSHPIRKYQLFDLFSARIFDRDDFSRIFYKKIYNPDIRVKIAYNVAGDDREFAITAAFSKGKLLIPLGAGSRWLLNTHSKFKISVYDNKGNPITSKILRKVELLHLRELGI